MNGRSGYPYTYYSGMGQQARPGYNPYSKYPDIAGAMKQFMQNMMMMKQMKQQQEEAERAKKLEQLQIVVPLAERVAKIHQARKATQKEIEEDKEARRVLSDAEYKLYKYKIPLEKTIDPSVAREKFEEAKTRMPSQRMDFIGGRLSDVKQRIYGYQSSPHYGRDPNIDNKIKNLNSLLNFYREMQAVGIERKASPEEWANVLKASNLDRVEQEGRFWEKKEAPTVEKGVGKPPFKNYTTGTIRGLGAAYLSASKKLLFFRGRIISANPNGTFTIEGKDYNLNF